MSYAQTYNQPFIIPRVAKSKTVISPGEFIKQKRLSLGMSFRDAAKASEGVVSHSTFKELEDGERPWGAVGLQTIEGIARAINTDFQELLNLIRQGQAPKLLDHASPIGFHMVEVVAASAGQPVTYPVPDAVWRRGTRVFQVQGDSMDNGSNESLKHGEWVLVDTTLTNIQEGKIYCIEVLGNGHTIKRARKMRGSWWLDSDNTTHESFQPEEANIIGMVYKILGARDAR